MKRESQKEPLEVRCHRAPVGWVYYVPYVQNSSQGGLQKEIGPDEVLEK
jgi:hypothetical protein